MTLSKLTEVALLIDSQNLREIRDDDLITANKRFNSSSSSSDPTANDQWSYKDGLAALMAAESISNHSSHLVEQATNSVYSTFPRTLSGNPYYGGQEIFGVQFDRPDEPRKVGFYELVGDKHRNRKEDARNLILTNKNWIASAPSVVNRDDLSSIQEKCIRDIEFFLEAIAYNIVEGGNSQVYDYAMISRNALQKQSNESGPSFSTIVINYELAINGTSNGSNTDEGVRDRLRMVLDGSAKQDPDITYGDRFVSVIATADTFLDLILDVIDKGAGSLARRSNPYGDQGIGEGRLADAAKLITESDSNTYDDGNGNVGLKGWIATPPVVTSDTSTYDPSRYPRDLKFFLDAIAYNLKHTGNDRVHDYAVQSRQALLDQANKSGTPSYEEIVENYKKAFNGGDGKEGFRSRLVKVIQGDAIIDNSPIDLSKYDITPAADSCMDVVSAVHVYLDMILQILESDKGGQAVKKTEGYETVMIPDNRPPEDSPFQREPFSYNGTQISKCIRDIEYYVRYLTYGLVANDTGLLDKLFLDELKEVNETFGLDPKWYKEALRWLREELENNPQDYFLPDETETMPSDTSVSFTVTQADQKDKAVEFIEYIRSSL
jgi:hypothetical protein